MWRGAEGGGGQACVRAHRLPRSVGSGEGGVEHLLLRAAARHSPYHQAVEVARPQAEARLGDDEPCPTDAVDPSQPARESQTPRADGDDAGLARGSKGDGILEGHVIFNIPINK